MTVEITYEQLLELLECRHGDSSSISSARERILRGIVKYQKQLDRADIRANRFRVMHFISQAAHETDGFKTLEEYASGGAYEGRQDLGNTEPGDGPRYKGRGIFMLTGRYNYRTVGERIGIDLESKPARAKEARVSVMTAADYWRSRNMNVLADGDHEENIRRVTRAINGGYNGLDDRRAWFMCAGRIWKDQPAPEETDFVELRISRTAAEELKRVLNEK